MKTFQFEVCNSEGPTGEKTPIVSAESITEAMNHQDITNYFKDKPEYRIYKVVGK